MDDLHRTGLRLAQAYDILPYETPAMALLRPRSVLGFGAVFGCPGAPGDVLDLGCGTGVQLAEAGQEMPGRLVGVDLSAEHCRRAAVRLAPFGARAVLQARDVLDLTPESLGQFDLIYAVGLLFVVPAPVRDHLLRLIGACLRPGGVAVISHYGGALPAARAWLHRVIRAEVAPDLPPLEAVLQGRQALQRLMAGLPTRALLRDAAEQTAGQPDNIFFPEVFNPFYEPLSAVELNRTLAAFGLGYLGAIEARVQLAPMPQTRAFDADADDLAYGGYHYSLFGKGAQAPDITAPFTLWRTVLRAEGGEFFARGDGGPSVHIAHAPTRLLLEAIAGAPCPFLEAAPPQERPQTARNLRDLWRERLVWAVRTELAATTG